MKYLQGSHVTVWGLTAPNRGPHEEALGLLWSVSVSVTSKERKELQSI